MENKKYESKLVNLFCPEHYETAGVCEKLLGGITEFTITTTDLEFKNEPLLAVDVDFIRDNLSRTFRVYLNHKDGCDCDLRLNNISDHAPKELSA